MKTRKWLIFIIAALTSIKAASQDYLGAYLETAANNSAELKSKFNDESHIMVKCKGEELIFEEMGEEKTSNDKTSTGKPKKVKPQSSN